MYDTATVKVEDFGCDVTRSNGVEDDDLDVLNTDDGTGHTLNLY